MIRKVKKEELKHFAKLQVEAYPGFFKRGKEDVLRILKTLERYKEEPCLFGYFDGEEMIGCMILYLFSMNYNLEAKVKVCGLGSLAVSMARKKEKIAYEMMLFYENYGKEHGCVLNALYPFNFKFYEGFGYGKGSLQQWLTFSPESIRKSFQASGIKRANKKDLPQIFELMNEVADHTHGMFYVHEKEIDTYGLMDWQKAYIYKNENKITGFLLLDSKNNEPENPLDNTLVVHKFYHSSPQAFQAMWSFLRRQQDQFRWIEMATKDESVHLCLEDIKMPLSHLMPHVSHFYGQVGMGMMYKVLDEAFFLKASPEKNLKVGGFYVKDELSGERFLFGHEANGKPQAEISKALFSSWVMGLTSLSSCVEKGILKELSLGEATVLDETYLPKQRPDCRTSF